MSSDLPLSHSHLRPSDLRALLVEKPRTWLVTGAAGFIGAHLVQELLSLDQLVVGLDDFSTGTRENLEAVQSEIPPEQFRRFRFIEGDIRDPGLCNEVCKDVDVILHEAALASVPVSIRQPGLAHTINVDGFLNLALAAKRAGAKKMVFASSSAVYGDSSDFPLVEERVGRLLSPYAATKRINELYAEVFASDGGVRMVGLRYFNVYGPRQRPDGPYAAVIPKWIEALSKGERPIVYGDGSATRSFCFVKDVVTACLMTSVQDVGRSFEVYNVGGHSRISLNQLFGIIRDVVGAYRPEALRVSPVFEPLRPGDILHSGCSIEKLKRHFGLAPGSNLLEGLQKTVPTYLGRGLGGRGEARQAPALENPV